MFQKKVTIKKNGDICIEVSNETGKVKVDIANYTPYFGTKKKVFDTDLNYDVKLVLDGIIDSIYSIGLDKLDPEKNFAEYDLVKEE